MSWQHEASRSEPHIPDGWHGIKLSASRAFEEGTGIVLNKSLLKVVLRPADCLSSAQL